jgi:hypothetical protein
LPFVSGAEQIALVRDKLSSATKDSLTDTVDWFAFALPLPIIIAHPSTNNNQKIAKPSVRCQGQQQNPIPHPAFVDHSTANIYNETHRSSITPADG